MPQGAQSLPGEVCRVLMSWPSQVSAQSWTQPLFCLAGGGDLDHRGVFGQGCQPLQLPMIRRASPAVNQIKAGADAERRRPALYRSTDSRSLQRKVIFLERYITSRYLARELATWELGSSGGESMLCINLTRAIFCSPS